MEPKEPGHRRPRRIFPRTRRACSQGMILGGKYSNASRGWECTGSFPVWGAEFRSAEPIAARTNQ